MPDLELPFPVYNGQHEGLLQSTNAIWRRFEEQAQLTGERFNIFDIFGKGYYEMDHSRMIGALLDPKGKHGQGEVFLLAFLEVFWPEVKLPLYHPSVVLEKDFGPVKGSGDTISGGRIDITIYPGNTATPIVIENKPWARDQQLQLLRYYNNFSQNCRLIYLTLDGADPSPESLGHLDKNICKCHSYATDLLRWIERCIQLSAHIPFIRESLAQYANIIKRMTNQNEDAQMSKQIVDSVLESDSLVQSFFYLTANSEKVKRAIAERLKQDLKVKMQAKGYKCNINPNFGFENDTALLFWKPGDQYNWQLYSYKNFSPISLGLHPSDELENKIPIEPNLNRWHYSLQSLLSSEPDIATRNSIWALDKWFQPYKSIDTPDKWKDMYTGKLADHFVSEVLRLTDVIERRGLSLSAL